MDNAEPSPRWPCRREFVVAGSDKMKLPPYARLALAGSILMWSCAVAAGLWTLWGYAATPGPTAAAPARWPADTQIQRASGLPTLVMLVHPHCPCSRASIGELAVLMARCQGKVAAHVLFFKPGELPGDWQKTDLWRSAAAIPGVHVICDVDGSEAHLFRAATSGQTLLYDDDGQLRFNGGITGARGHFGDNAGLDTVVAQIQTGSRDENNCSVFGCPLPDPNVSQTSVR